MSNGILSRRESDRDIIKYTGNELILSYCNSISQSPANIKREILSRNERIFKSPAVVAVLFGMLEYRASTGYFLKRTLKIGDPTFYRAINVLLDERLILVATPVGPYKRRGPSSRLFAVLDYTPDDIAEAMRRDRYMRTPAYSEVIRLKQLILEEYIGESGEIHQKEVYSFVKRRRKNTFPIGDVAQLLCIELQREGCKLTWSNT